MNTTGKKYGGRTKGTPNKLSTEIKESLSLLISEAVSSLDINAMSKSEKLKLIQLGLPYIVTKAQTEEVVEEQKFTLVTYVFLMKEKWISSKASGSSK